jgi:hypothetical protein
MDTAASRPRANALAISYKVPLDAIVGAWKRSGLTIDAPGFYDHPHFVRAEQAQPGYVNTYARYVRDQAYSEGYLARSEAAIQAAAALLSREVKADGRSNLCVTVSKVLSKILEREKVWNYVVVGAFSAAIRIDGSWQTHTFYPFDVRPVDAAHAWVVAPPFHIVDLTLRQQRYPGPAAAYLPDRLLTTYTFDAEAAAHEVCAPALLLGLRLKGFTDEDVLDQAFPAFKQFSSVFPPKAVQTASATLKYTPTRVITPEGDLDRLQSLTINGASPEVLYQRLRGRI